MALSRQALTLISISAILFSTFSVEASIAPAPAVSQSADSIFGVSLAVNPSEIKLPDVTAAVNAEINLPAAGSPIEKQAVAAKVITKQMQQVENKIEEFSTTLKKRSDVPEDCIKQCEEVYGAAQDDIKSTLDSLESQNLVKANFDISAVSTNVDTCNECFKEMIGEDPELKKFDDWVRGITEEALTTIEKVVS